jgi:hypothetical protein
MKNTMMISEINRRLGFFYSVETYFHQLNSPLGILIIDI